MEVTAYYTSHAPYTLNRGNSDWTGFAFQAVSGRFANDETGVMIEVQHLSEQRYQVKIGEQESVGALVSPTKLLVDSCHFEIEYENSLVNTLLLNGDRLRAVRFSRVP